ncbi:unnamed protein product [Alopecurus aequalis]
MAMSSAAEDAWPARGFTFSADDHVLINDFLRLKHAPGTDKHNGKGGHWYFFTPARRRETKTKNGGCGRRQRAVGEGYTWHTEGGKKPVLDAAGEKRVGYKEKLSYGFYELQPGARTATLTRLGWCMTEFSLDDAGAGLVLCKVNVSTHKTETTYASVMKATADSKKRKAGDDLQPDAPRPGKKPTTYPSVMKATAQSKKRKAGDEPHPDVPRPQTPRPQESEEFERWLLSDEDDTMPAGAVDDGSVDPAGFFADILEDVEEFCGARSVAPVQHDECTLEELLVDNDMPALETAFKSDCEGCSKPECEICIQKMLEELTQR